MKELSLHILDITKNSVSAGAKNIRLSLTEAEDHALTIVIADDGCGIPADRIDNLFTGYLDRKDTPTDGSRNNMGIGLSVCATIIKAHGSEIFAKNLSPRGAAFYFTLEMEDVHEHE